MDTAARSASRLATLLRAAGLALCGLCASGCSTLYFQTLNAGTPVGGPEQVRPVPGQALAMDIYRSQRPRAPVVVFLYGGRWQDGSRQQYGFVGERLAAEGVLAMVPDYRHYPEVRFPAFVEDAAAAVAWAKRHAREFGGDPERVFVAGHSAGAHIAALLGTDARYLGVHGLRPRDLAGVIGLAGPYDFLPLEDADLVEIFGTDPQAQAQSQPVNFVDGDEPPFLLLHGESDLLVWLANSQHLKQRFDEAGQQATLRSYAGIGHIRILAALRYPALATVRADLLDFVNGHHAGEAGAPPAAVAPTTAPGTDSGPAR